jgi:putative oxidoreductase
MNKIIDLLIKSQHCLNESQKLDFLLPLLLRLYLAPVFWVAGMNKVAGIEGVIQWFGNSDWGLGLPFPELLAWLATLTEVVGAVLLLTGLGVRWISIPLMITMLVAMFSVHWHNGWQAVADPMSALAGADAGDAIIRLDAAKEILKQHGNYEWLTEKGGFVISNNGIEWASTYFVMCLTLFFIGGGRYVSLDYYLNRKFMIASIK